MKTQLQLRVCGSEQAAGKSNIFSFLEEEAKPMYNRGGEKAKKKKTKKKKKKETQGFGRFLTALCDEVLIKITSFFIMNTWTVKVSAAE